MILLARYLYLFRIFILIGDTHIVCSNSSKDYNDWNSNKKNIESILLVVSLQELYSSSIESTEYNYPNSKKAQKLWDYLHNKIRGRHCIGIIYPYPIESYRWEYPEIYFFHRGELYFFLFWFCWWEFFEGESHDLCHLLSIFEPFRIYLCGIFWSWICLCLDIFKEMYCLRSRFEK